MKFSDANVYNYTQTGKVSLVRLMSVLASNTIQLLAMPAATIFWSCTWEELSERERERERRGTYLIRGN